MELEIRNKDIFPEPIQELMKVFHCARFFDEGMIVGSWVMPIYQELFGIRYVLRTMDIDFALQIITRNPGEPVNLEDILKGLGYVPILTASGWQKFSRAGFTVEFIVHRKGRKDDVVSIKRWNVTAVPLPFLDILLSFPLGVNFNEFVITVPELEAFFLHKLISSQRRIQETKHDKDLEQCSALTSKLNKDKLRKIALSFRFSKKTIRSILTSCEAIGFPPHTLGFLG
jgi:hypothetical protein